MASIDDAMLEKIAVYLRENLPVKSRQLGPRGKPVAYFSGKRMIDFLMASKFAKEQDEEAPIASRDDAIRVACRMMDRHNFYRGAFGEKKVKKKSDGTIKTKKIVLVAFGLPQAYDKRLFADADEPFVWTFDPVTKKTLMYGLLLLGGVCACAALPLWPNWLRNIVIAFLLFILIGRPGIWLVVWLVTFSRWNFYILPNLDEDNMAFDKRFSPVFLLERSETAAGSKEDVDGEEDDDDDDENGGDDDGAEGSGDDDN